MSLGSKISEVARSLLTTGSGTTVLAAVRAHAFNAREGDSGSERLRGGDWINRRRVDEAGAIGSIGDKTSASLQECRGFVVRAPASLTRRSYASLKERYRQNLKMLNRS